MASPIPSLGIDFGTSKCTMAWFNPATGRAEVLRNAEGHDETPALVYIGENEVLVGESARDALDLPEQSAGVILSVKSDLRRSWRYPVPGRPTPVEVAAHILRKMRTDAQAGHFRAEVTRAVITCPASFDPVERDLLRDAASLAGFAEIVLLDEPVSAALAYAHSGYQVGSHVLVYDLGAGTFDAALLVRGDDGVYRIGLPPTGLRCGGDDFDRALYGHCDTLAQKQLGHSLGRDDDLDLRFLLECRKRKENLTIRDRCHFSSLIQGPDGLTKQFRHEVDRATFEALIAPTLEPTIRLTHALLEQAAHRNIDVASVILVGGSSRIPLAVRLLREALPVEPQRWDKQDVAVALGAALYARDYFEGAATGVTTVARVRQDKDIAAPAEAQDLPPTHTNHLLARAAVDCMQEGEESLTRGDLTAALRSFEEAHLLAPDDPGGLVGMGRASLAMGDSQGAVVALQHAMRLDPNAPGTAKSLGEALLHSGQASRAVAAMETQADTIQDVGFHVLFGYALGTIGRHAQALDEFLFALTLDPSAEDAFTALQALLGQPGPRTQAIAQTRQWLESRQSPRLHRNLGFALTAAKEYINAGKHLTHTMTAGYSPTITLYGLGELSVAVNNVEAAQKQFTHAYQQDPRNRRALFRAGCTAFENRQSDLAVDQFSQLIDADPDYPQVHLKLGQAFVALRAYDRAVVELQEAAHQQPAMRGITDLLAKMQERARAESVISELPARWRHYSGVLTITRQRLWFLPREPDPQPVADGKVSTPAIGVTSGAYLAIRAAMKKGVDLPIDRIVQFQPGHSSSGEDDVLLVHLPGGETHHFLVGSERDAVLKKMLLYIPRHKFDLSPALLPSDFGQGDRAQS